MANWNATVTNALIPAAEQVGAPDTTTTPTLTRITSEWNALGPIVSIMARSAGLSGTVADWTDDGLAYFQRAEALLTSARALELKGSVIAIGTSGTDNPSEAARLRAEGEAMLEAATLRSRARGLVTFTGAYLAADPRTASDWTRNKDPGFDSTPGTGDRDYAREPHSKARDQH